MCMISKEKVYFFETTLVIPNVMDVFLGHTILFFKYKLFWFDRTLNKNNVLIILKNYVYFAAIL